MILVARLALALAYVGLWSLGPPGQLAAQDTPSDSAGPHDHSLTRADADLPADRIADLLALLPGVASLEHGEWNVRGAGRTANAAYLDGIPIGPARRGFGGGLLGGSWLGDNGIGVALGTNAFESIDLIRGMGAAELASARGGVLAVESRRPALAAGRASFRAGWATDALFGQGQGLDFNRLTLNAEGGAGRFSGAIAATVEGQGSARLGLDQNASPVYLSNGVDTSVTVSGPGGTTSVDVLRFRPSPGIRIPASASSNYAVLGRFGYRLGLRHRIDLTALASQDQARAFDYENLYNPQQLGARRAWSQVLTGSWHGELTDGEGLRVAAEAHLSYQRDRSTAGPLDPASELTSRDPFGGFMVGALDFRFDARAFPVNQELVRNFRSNSGRLTPYDLGNTTQYELVDQYRNNAYGLTGFSESGGPVGVISLSNERRIVGKAAVDAWMGRGHHLRAGLEVTGYQIAFYSSALTSQAVADAYVESPRRRAAYADYALAVTGLSVSAGIRYDHFSTGASRPYATDANGNRYWFPRISSMPPSAAPLFLPDRGHGRISPRVRAIYSVSPSIAVQAGLSSVAQMPDLSAILTGINTDLNTTNTAYPYGSDLDFERATIAEVGLGTTFRERWSADAAIWTRNDQAVAQLQLVSVFDPQRLADLDLRRYVAGKDRHSTGLDARVVRNFGAQGRVWISYSYASSAGESRAALDTRPHTLAGAVLYRTGEGPKRLPGFLRNVGLFGALRIASGTTYTRCRANDPAYDGVLSGEPCTPTNFGLNTARLPRMALVDLRVTKQISLGRGALTVFADARNLLNTGNIVRVFAQTGKASNPRERARVRQTHLDGLAAEAGANSVLQADSTMDLSFGGQAAGGCGAWTDQSRTRSATPNCVYLVRAEERFGDGDHLFTRSEQLRATDALYAVARGLQNFTGSGRRVRLGLEIGF